MQQKKPPQLKSVGWWNGGEMGGMVAVPIYL